MPEVEGERFNVPPLFTAKLPRLKDGAVVEALVCVILTVALLFIDKAPVTVKALARLKVVAAVVLLPIDRFA